MARCHELLTDVNRDQIDCRVVTVIVMFVVLACLNFDLVVDFPRIIREFHEEWAYPNPPNSPSKQLPTHPESPFKATKDGGEILDKLRELSRLASDGEDYTLTATQRQAWHKQNPCRSRSELPAMYASRKHVKNILSNPVWDKILDEYSNLHRICMKRVGNITEHFLNKSNITIPGCKFLVGEGTNGLGNRLLVTASAVLYAIASQRILLMPLRTNLKPVLCEPFVGSSWMLETDDMVPRYGNINTPWVEEDVFIRNMHTRLQFLKMEESQNHTQTTSSTLLPPLVDAVVVSREWAPHEWFYCSTEQKFLSEVPWVYLSGCLYSAPKLFASPPFSPSLIPIFPDRMVLTHLLRSTLLPGDRVWTRFKHLNHAYFQQSDRRVAVQLRFFDHFPYNTMSTVAIDLVINCVLKNGILPNVTDFIAASNSSTEMTRLSSSATPPPITTVFVASLYPDLHDRLREFYLRNPTESGEDVSLVQVTDRLYQSVGVEEDTEALVEMLLLSVSDELVVTPGSTFGGVAHAYGGLTPWFINTLNRTSTESCERGQSVDECQLEVTEFYYCPNDPPPAPPPDWNHGDLGEEEKPPTLVLGVITHHVIYAWLLWYFNDSTWQVSCESNNREEGFVVDVVASEPEVLLEVEVNGSVLAPLIGALQPSDDPNFPHIVHVATSALSPDQVARLSTPGAVDTSNFKTPTAVYVAVPLVALAVGFCSIYCLL